MYSFFWVYDALNRLIKEQRPSISTTTYVYDLAGNRVEMSVAHQDVTQTRTVTYTLDDNDRLLTETSDHTHTTEATHTVYTYDVTEQIGKKVYDGLDDTGIVESETTYTYNLQGRMSHVAIDSDGINGVDTETDYIYNANGPRVQQAVTENSTTTTHDYLVDENNLTGYSQVLEETIDAALAVAYTIGLDVIAQAKPNTPSNDVHFFLHDAHGSTRVLLDELAAVLETYAFDAYGNALDFDPTIALTTLLYSGEQFDAKIAMQYLRARYYDASVGRFNRLDPFFGNLDDPQSLNKYLYTHGNPVAGIDPTGLVFTFADLALTITISSILFSALAIEWTAARNKAQYLRHQLETQRFPFTSEDLQRELLRDIQDNRGYDALFFEEQAGARLDRYSDVQDGVLRTAETYAEIGIATSEALQYADLAVGGGTLFASFGLGFARVADDVAGSGGPTGDRSNSSSNFNTSSAFT